MSLKYKLLVIFCFVVYLINAQFDTSTRSSTIRFWGGDEIKEVLRNGEPLFSEIDYAFVQKELLELVYLDSLDEDSTQGFKQHIAFESAKNLQDEDPVLAIVADYYNPHYAVTSIVDDEILNMTEGMLKEKYFAKPRKFVNLNERYYLYCIANAGEDDSFFMANMFNANEYGLKMEKFEALKYNSFYEAFFSDQHHFYSSTLLDSLVKYGQQGLNIIFYNEQFLNQYRIWLSKIEEPENWLFYDADYPAAIHARKIMYVIAQLEDSTHPLAAATVSALKKINIIERNFD
ncbi:MAG: hypothetical protein AAGB24_08195 [Bacteroidota bacterium]